MKKNYFIILLTIFIGQLSYSQCTMNLRMYDDYGDGWNSNTITVTVNGTAVITAATLSGFGPTNGDGPEDISFTASTGDTVRTIWNGGGSYGYETGYEIIANDGSVLFQENMSGVGTTAGSTAPSGNSGNNFAFCPSCPAPSGLASSGVTNNAATISWSSVPALAFGIEYGPAGFTLGSGTQDTSATTMKSLSGLTANTTYDFYVKALCSLTDSSTVAGPFSFNTLCNTFSTFPFQETFDDTSSTEGCWSVLNNNGDGDSWNTDYTFNTFSGSQVAMFYSDYNSGNNDDYLISPKFTLSANQRMKFQTRVQSSGEPNDFQVVLSSTGTSASDFTITLLTDTISSTTYSERVIDLSSYSGDYYIAFKIPPGGLDGWRLYIDEFLIENIPNCPEPATASLGAHAITATTASIDWTEAGTATSWRVEIGAPGFTLGTGMSTIESNDTVALTGLTPFTTYEFYVTALCTATDSSPWVGPYSFTTLCNDTNVGPWMDNVEGHPSTNVITGISNCWSGTKTGTSFEWEITNSGTTGSSGTGALSANSGSNYFYTEASGAGASDTTTLVSPSVDLATMTSPFLEFYYHMFGDQMGSVSVEVFDGTTWTSELTISGQQQATQASPWNQQFVDLTSYSGIIQIRFVAVSNGSYEGDICLDDIAVIEEPACFAPAMAITSGTLNDTTTASWSQQFGSPSKYYIEYDITGFTQGTGTIDSTTTTMLGIGGLIGSTTYDYYVVAYCGGSDSSTWVGPITFTTKCDPYLPTHSEDFSSYLPTCWEEANGVLTTNSNVIIGSSDWGADGFANVGFTGAARMNIYSTNRNDWLISAPIDLGDGSIPYQVEYDVALTDYSSTGPDAMGADDTLALVISTDFGQTWSSANILRNYVSGDEPSNAGNREFLDLTGYSGIVQFGFYGASSVSNADYDVHIDNFLVTNLCVPTAVSYTDTACGTYTSPTGKIWTMPGVYMDTLQMQRGCDSVLTITLVVNNTTASVSPTVCDTYTAPSGAVYTTTGMYMDTIMNSIGCDSIISINLTVNYNISVTDVITVCNSYTRPNGTVVNYSSTFFDTIPTSLGCDSMVTTVLTVNYNNSRTLSVSACGSYTSPSGKVWTTSGTRYDTIPTTLGCDSLMTINLTITANTAETRTISACDSYTVPETGMMYSASGTYTDVTTNAFGCVHTITTVLTINSANAGTVNVSGITMSSTATGVSYKWVDCDNNFSFLLEDTMQTYTPPRNGSYAVWVTTPEGCSDTSACVSIQSVSLDEYVISENDINIFPNPASDYLTIDILNQNEDVEVRLVDVKGRLVYTKSVSSDNNKVTFDVTKLAEGTYTVTVFNDFFTVSKKVTVVK